MLIIRRELFGGQREELLQQAFLDERLWIRISRCELLEYKHNESSLREVKAIEEQ